MLSGPVFGTLNAGSPELCSKFRTEADRGLGPEVCPCSSCWGCILCCFGCGVGDMMKEDRLSPFGVAGAEKLVVLDISEVGP